MAFISFRKVRGFTLSFPVLKFRIERFATPDLRTISLVENCFVSVRS